jgi:hypothetical protein
MHALHFAAGVSAVVRTGIKTGALLDRKTGGIAVILSRR